MAKGAGYEWIGDSFQTLGAWGPGWLIVGMVSVAFVIRIDKIAPAVVECWRTVMTTKQKLAHQQKQFTAGMRRREAKIKKKNDGAGRRR